jgi:hypothetical protein
MRGVGIFCLRAGLYPPREKFPEKQNIYHIMQNAHIYVSVIGSSNATSFLVFLRPVLSLQVLREQVSIHRIEAELVVRQPPRNLVHIGAKWWWFPFELHYVMGRTYT